MNDFSSGRVLRCIEGLGVARTPTEAIQSWLLLEAKSPELCAIVSLPDYPRISIPASLRRSMTKPANCLVPYFASENLYFIDDEMVNELAANVESKIGVDYSLMFDTNVASYINKLIRGESLGGMQNEVVSLLDGMLHDGLNFDHLFYMVENSKSIYRLILGEQNSKLNFWKLLNRKFRQSLVSLQLFRSIDSEHYKKTSAPRMKFSYRVAARCAIDFTYHFYASPTGRKHILGVLLIQRLLLLQLIGMIRIQFSSNKSAAYKLREYFDYVSKAFGGYFDREAILAHKYFLDRNEVAILKKINMGKRQKRLLKKLDNLAWDMAAPRFMEELMSTGGNGRFFVPFFLTFDEGLRDALSMYRVKGALLKKDGSGWISIPVVNSYRYFEQHGCAEVLLSFYNDPERQKREKPTLESVHRSIFHEYRKLCQVLNQESKVSASQ